MILQVNVLMQILFKLPKLLKNQFMGDAGITRRVVVVGQLPDGSHKFPRFFMLWLHYTHGAP